MIQGRSFQTHRCPEAEGETPPANEPRSTPASSCLELPAPVCAGLKNGKMASHKSMMGRAAHVERVAHVWFSLTSKMGAKVMGADGGNENTGSRQSVSFIPSVTRIRKKRDGAACEIVTDVCVLFAGLREVYVRH